MHRVGSASGRKLPAVISDGVRMFAFFPAVPAWHAGGGRRQIVYAVRRLSGWTRLCGLSCRKHAFCGTCFYRQNGCSKECERKTVLFLFLSGGCHTAWQMQIVSGGRAGQKAGVPAYGGAYVSGAFVPYLRTLLKKGGLG